VIKNVYFSQKTQVDLIKKKISVHIDQSSSL